MAKGLSEIIAIFLIIIIVVALAALAYTWFNGLFNTMTSQQYTYDWECTEWNGPYNGCSIQTVDPANSALNTNITDMQKCINYLNNPKICWTYDWTEGTSCVPITVTWTKDCSKYIYTKNLVGQ